MDRNDETRCREHEFRYFVGEKGCCFVFSWSYNRERRWSEVRLNAFMIQRESTELKWEWDGVFILSSTLALHLQSSDWVWRCHWYTSCLRRWVYYASCQCYASASAMSCACSIIPVVCCWSSVLVFNGLFKTVLPQWWIYTSVVQLIRRATYGNTWQSFAFAFGIVTQSQTHKFVTMCSE